MVEIADNGVGVRDDSPSRRIPSAEPNGVVIDASNQLTELATFRKKTDFATRESHETSLVWNGTK